jgi:hypothetical protein
MAKAGSAPNRVQGITSSVADITLRNSERQVALELGVAVTDAKLTRTIFGASTLELEVFDPERRLLRNILLAQKWDAELDGLHFRWPGALPKSGDTLTVTLEDRWLALLREKEGPKRAVRGEGPHKMTRAEFIKRLIEEACGTGLRFYCPQLHKQQPIKTEKQAKDAKAEARENRGKGIGDVKLTMDGAPVSASQRELGEKALEIAESFSAPFEVEVAVLEALMAESSLGTAAPGNVLEALEPYAKIRSAAEEISGFIAGEPTWTGTTAISYHKQHPGAAPYEIAQAVQNSGAGESTNGKANYGKFEAEARHWVEAFGGGEGDESTTIEEPYEFVVKKKQDYWSAIKEMAQEVNWRAFIVADVFYFMPEPELFRSEVRIALDGQTPWVENIDFEYDGNSPITEVEIEALVSQWSPPPASVITLADYGPASIGFGDAPKADQKIGLSDNRNATTGEGRARYLISSIEVPLADDPAERMATIKAHKPTAPLPEPANETKSASGHSSSGAGGSAELGDSSVPGHPELEPGISEVVNSILKQFPKLVITSTTGGTHATDSYHYLGRAADIASGDYSLMNEAAAWINSSGLWQHLTEGIHNPGSEDSSAVLSVKDQKKVPTSYWGAETWAAHQNHIHVAV